MPNVSTVFFVFSYKLLIYIQREREREREGGRKRGSLLQTLKQLASRMLYFKNFLVGVLAGYCRPVLVGIGGYWWALEGIGEQRRIAIGVLKRMPTYTRYNILRKMHKD
jgi:hypothetical protein